MADPYAGIAVPAQDPYAGVAVPTDTNHPYHPSRTSDYVGTRLVNVVSGILGTPRAAADLVGAAAQRVGMDPRATGVLVSPLSAAGQVLPSTQEIRDFIYNKIGMPQVNTPGEGGKMLDTGVETALGGAIGGPRALLPAFVGGATSQGAGDIPGIKGTGYEPFVRAGVGLLTGTLTGAGQNLAGNVVQGVKNTLGVGPTEQRAAAILGRALNRDKLTASDLTPAGQDQPLFTGGGENVKGALRGSIAAPGEARTTFNDTAQNYLAGADQRAQSAISGNVSNLPPLATRIDTLSNERAAASNPAYRAAGIPPRIEATETAAPGPMQPSTILDANGNPIMRPGPDVITKTFNTPIVQSDKLDALIRDSKDIQTAIANARRLPEYKDLPVNSMAMLDKIYKHLGGLAQSAASKENNGAVARDLDLLRNQFKDAITEANPAYGQALKAFSEPSELMDAAQAGYDAFKKNLPTDVSQRQFAAMPEDQQNEFLGGVAQWLREQAGKTQGETATGNRMPATAAEKIFNSQAVADRLKAILPPDKYEAFAKSMVEDKRGAQAMRDVGQGSRTIPMGLEAQDNNQQAVGFLNNLLHGRFVSATGNALGAMGGRIAQGRSEAVNNTLANWLTATDPQKVGLVRSLAERARLDALAKSAGRRNALAFGAAVPAVYGASQ